MVAMYRFLDILEASPIYAPCKTAFPGLKRIKKLG
jgi:hypothetical protein